jgi:hypothetical protein
MVRLARDPLGAVVVCERDRGERPETERLRFFDSDEGHETATRTKEEEDGRSSTSRIRCLGG